MNSQPAQIFYRINNLSSTFDASILGHQIPLMNSLKQQLSLPKPQYQKMDRKFDHLKQLINQADLFCCSIQAYLDDTQKELDDIVQGEFPHKKVKGAEED